MGANVTQRSAQGRRTEFVRVQNLFSKFEPVSPAGRIVPMEGIRGFAAMLVLLVHFRALFGHYAEGTALFSAFQILGSLGHTGVDLFFILSGYLIYGIIMDPRFKFWRFFTHRAQRLYPTFLVVFALYLAASFFLPTRSKIPSSWPQATVYIIANLLMLPGTFPIRPIITVAWSLSYEWSFYILVPILVANLRIRKWSWKCRGAFVAVLSAVFFGVSLHGTVLDSRFALFGAGILLWELLQNTKIATALPRSGELVAAALFGLNLLVIGLHGSTIGPTDLVLAYVPRLYAPSLFLSGLLFTLYSISYRGLLCRVFSWNPLRWVGNMSYSYYLIHGVTLLSIQAVARRASHSTHLSSLAFLLVFVSCILATLVASGILYLIVERPLSLALVSSRPAAGRCQRNLQVIYEDQQKLLEELSEKLIAPAEAKATALGDGSSP